MTHQPRGNHSQHSAPKSNLRATEKGRQVRNGLLAVLAVGGAATYAAVSGSQEQSAKQKAKVEALDNSNSVIERIVVLKGGVHVHSTPIGASDANNRVGTVPTGKEWVVHTPLVTGQPGTYSVLEPDWIAFTPPGAPKADSLNGRADTTVYANLQSLEDQGIADVYDYPAQPPNPGPGESGGPQTLLASVNNDGSIKITGLEQNPTTNGDVTFVDPLAATSYAEAAGQYAVQAHDGTTPNPAQQMTLTFPN